MKGGIIASKADRSKNSLITGIITSSKIKTHSNSSETTIGFRTYILFWDVKSTNNDDKLNEAKKLSLSIDMPVHGCNNVEGLIFLPFHREQSPLPTLMSRNRISTRSIEIQQTH